MYAAFGDKERLFREAAARYTDRLFAGLACCLDAPTAREAIRRLLEVTASTHTEPGTPPGCLVMTEPTLSRERGQVRDVVAARIERGQREGDVPEHVDAMAHACYLEAVMAGMSARARDGASHEELAAIAAIAEAPWSTSIDS